MNTSEWVVITFIEGWVLESAHPDKPGLTLDQAEAILAAYVASVQRREKGMQS
jgi:hypothetical protein